MVRVARVRAEIEDEYLDDRVVDVLTKIHGLKDVWVGRHLVIKGLECDAVIHGHTEKGFLRTIGVELKRYDVKKVAEQALRRRPLFNYMYFIVGFDSDYVLHSLHKNGYLSDILRNGVGVIVFEFVQDASHPFVLLRSRFNSRPIYRPNKPLVKFMGDG